MAEMQIILLVVAVVAAVPAIEFIRQWWRRGPGERRATERVVERLSVGLPVERFSSAFGPPVRTRKRDQKVMSWDERGVPIEERTVTMTERLYANRWCFVQAVTGEGDSIVERFAVSSRHKRFRPSFVLPWSNTLPPFVRLRTSRFCDLGSPNRAVAWHGVQNGGYFEEHYRGRPGGYLWIQASIGPVTWTGRFDVLAADVLAVETVGVPVPTDLGSDVSAKLAEPSVEAVRSVTLATYGESGSGLDADPFPVGPDDTILVSRLRLDEPPRTAFGRRRLERRHRRWRAEVDGLIQDALRQQRDDAVGDSSSQPDAS